MRTRLVPGTDLAVSEIGFGCGGNAGLMVRGDATAQRKAVARALELGINYFDNAPDYGDGRGETNLGLALRDIGARPMLNSKVEIRRQDLDDVAGHVVRSVEGSLRRLGVDCIDVLQIHNGPVAAPPEMAGTSYAVLWIEHFLRPGGAMDGLARLREAGKIRHAGFICRGEDAAEVRRLLDTGQFRMINVPYTLLNPTAGRAPPARFAVDRDYGQVLDLAAAAGCGVAIFSPLAGGFLTESGARGEDRHPLARPVDPSARRNQGQAELAARFLPVARACGLSLAQLAYRFVSMHTAVTTAIGGFTTIEQIEEVTSLQREPPLSAETMAAIAAIWDRPMD